MFESFLQPPRDAQGWFQLGLAKLQQGDRERARRCFTMVAAMDPSLVPALDAVTMLVRPADTPESDEILMGVVRLPPWATPAPNCGDRTAASPPERLLGEVLSCLTCEREHADACTAGVNDEDLTKGILFALRNLIEQGGRLDPATLAESVADVVGEALDTVRTFKETVARRAFDVAFQPIVDIRRGDVHHYEALCRFDSSAATPFRTISFAEQAGLVHEFDLAMVSLVVERMRAALNAGDDLRVAVNVSGYSIGVPAYFDGLMELLRANRWTRGRLSFEITESSRMTELDGANQFIQSLRGLGHQVCLDDFGAGAASFQYLSMLDVDVVKIDGSAIANARNGGKGSALLSALTDLCRRIGVATVAEMVEDADCLSFCRDCGCDYAQGYLFGRPAPSVSAFRPLPNRHVLTAG